MNIISTAFLVSMMLILGATPLERQHADQLAALRPTDPQAYFYLGEDIAEVASSQQDRALAIRLFAYADHFAPQRFRRSAIFAIRPLVDDPAVQRLLEADLRAWSDDVDFLPARSARDEQGDVAVMAAIQALSDMRRGDRQALRRSLQTEDAAKRLDALSGRLPGNSDWMLQKSRTDTFGRDGLSEDAVIATLQVQGELLGSRGQPWSVVLKAERGAPMTVIDPVPLVEIFSIDPERATYREGRWE